MYKQNNPFVTPGAVLLLLQHVLNMFNKNMLKQVVQFYFHFNIFVEHRFFATETVSPISRPSSLGASDARGGGP